MLNYIKYYINEIIMFKEDIFIPIENIYSIDINLIEHIIVSSLCKKEEILKSYINILKNANYSNFNLYNHLILY